MPNSLPHAVWRASRIATRRRAATRAPLVILLPLSSTRSRPRTATSRPSYGSPRRDFSVIISFLDAEGRRESKISLTRRSPNRSSARRRSRSTRTSSPRRPSRPRPTRPIRHASRYRRPPGGRRSPAKKRGVDPRGLSRTGLARKWSNNPNKNSGIVCILTRGDVTCTGERARAGTRQAPSEGTRAGPRQRRRRASRPVHM